MVDPFYCWEVFLRATNALCVGEGEIKERLAQAGLEISVLSVDSLPEEIKPKYTELMKALRMRGEIKKTVSTMRKAKAKILAEEIQTIESTLRILCHS
jgi:hypothetical protein